MAFRTMLVPRNDVLRAALNKFNTELGVLERRLNALRQQERFAEHTKNVTLATFWSFHRSFTIERADGPADRLFQREPSLVNWLPRILHLMRLNAVPHQTFRMDAVRHDFLGPLAPADRVASPANIVTSPALAHGGRVQVEMQPPDGATTHVWIRNPEGEQRTTLHWRYGSSLHPLACSVNSKALHEALLAPVHALSGLSRLDARPWETERFRDASIRLSQIFEPNADGRQLMNWFDDLIAFLEGRDDYVASWRIASAMQFDAPGLLLSYGLQDQGLRDPAASVGESKALARFRNATMSTAQDAFLERIREWRKGLQEARRRRAHTIRGPILAHLARLEDLAGDAREGRNVAAQVERLVRSMRRLKLRIDLDDFFDRPERDRERRDQQFELQRCDVHRMVEETIAFYGWSGVVRLSEPGEAWLAFAPPVVVDKVLENLLTNAVDHAQDSGAARVDVRMVRDNDDSGFSSVLIANNGPRVPQPALDTLISMASKGNASTSKANGNGYGLIQVFELEGWLRAFLAEDHRVSRFTSAEYRVPDTLLAMKELDAVADGDPVVQVRFRLPSSPERPR